MPPGFLPRAEFDGYVRRHEADAFAHAALIGRLQTQGAQIREEVEGRLGKLELWQARIVGAVAMLTFLVTAGVITAVVELLRK